MSTPEILKNSPVGSPKTFGDLYTQIQEKNILTPEEENALRDRAMKQYGMLGLIAKRQEAIGSNTRNELSGLLSGLPEREQILAKLDSMLPGYTPIESAKKTTEQAKNTPKSTLSTPDIGGDLIASLTGSTPAIAATVTGLGAAIVGTGLITEKWWKSTLVDGFGKLKDWIVGLLPENGIFAGLKDGIMKLFAKLGGGLGINDAVADTADKAKEQIKNTGIAYGTTKSIVKRFFLKKEGNATAIYDSWAFQSMKYSDVKKIYDNRKTNSVTKAFGLSEWTGTTDADIEEALAIFVDDTSKKGKHLRSQIDKTIGKEKEGLSMNELFIRVSSPLSYLHTMGDIGDAISSGNINAISDNIWFDVNLDTGDISGPLKANMEKMPAKVRMGMLVNYHGLQFLNTKQAMGFIDSTQKYTEEEKKDWEKVFDFGEKFQKAVLSNPKINLGMQSDFQKAFASPWLSYFGLASLYACTGGQTDFESMTAAEKLAFYGGCASVAGSMDSFAKGKFGMRYLDKLNFESSEIPPEVKELGTEILGGAVKATAHWLKEMWLAILGMAVEKPQYILGIAAVGYATGGIRKWWHKWRYHS